MILRFTATLVFVAAISGCAALGPAELPSAAALVPPATPPVAAPVAAPVRVAPTSTNVAPELPPSREALAVLASIAEPVPGQAAGGKGTSPAVAAPASHPVVPPATAVTVAPATAAPITAAPVASARAGAADSVAGRVASARTAAGDSVTAPPDTSSIPVPAPTLPLGAGSQAMPATPELPVVTPPPAPVAPAPSPGPIVPVAAGPDTCWRVQLGAPSERARGRLLRDASQSLLMAPMTLVSDAGRWKVRTRDCLSRAGAESVRDRAAASGFKGVFLVRFVERR